jgi:hypothetical protein
MTAGDDDKKDTNGSHTNGALTHDHEADEHDDDETADIEPPVEESPESPSQVVELSAACARYILTKYKVPLDGTPDTLSLVDQYVRDARAEIAVRPEAAALIAASIGAYFGEVVKRAFGAEWFAEGDSSA